MRSQSCNQGGLLSPRSVLLMLPRCLDRVKRGDVRARLRPVVGAHCACVVRVPGERLAVPMPVRKPREGGEFDQPRTGNAAQATMGNFARRTITFSNVHTSSAARKVSVPSSRTRAACPARAGTPPGPRGAAEARPWRWPARGRGSRGPRCRGPPTPLSAGACFLPCGMCDSRRLGEGRK